MQELEEEKIAPGQNVDAGMEYNENIAQFIDIPRQFVQYDQDDAEVLVQQNFLYQNLRGLQGQNEVLRQKLDQFAMTVGLQAKQTTLTRIQERIQNLQDQQRVVNYLTTRGQFQNQQFQDRFGVAKFMTTIARWSNSAKGRTPGVNDTLLLLSQEDARYLQGDRKKLIQYTKGRGMVLKMREQQNKNLSKEAKEAIEFMENDKDIKYFFDIYDENAQLVGKDIKMVGAFELQKDVEIVDQLTMRDITAAADTNKMMGALVKMAEINPEVIGEIKDQHVKFIQSFYDLNQVYYDKNLEQDYRLGPQYQQDLKKAIQERHLNIERLVNQSYQPSSERSIPKDPDQKMSFEQLRNTIQHDSSYIPPVALRKFPEYEDFFLYKADQSQIEQYIQNFKFKPLYEIKHVEWRAMPEGLDWNKVHRSLTNNQMIQLIDQSAESGQYDSDFQRYLRDAKSIYQRNNSNFKKLDEAIYNIALSKGMDIKQMNDFSNFLDEIARTEIVREQIAIDPETQEYLTADQLRRRNEDFQEISMQLLGRSLDLKQRETSAIQSFIERQIGNFENLKFKKNRQFMEGEQILISEKLPPSDVRRQMINRQLEQIPYANQQNQQFSQTFYNAIQYQQQQQNDPYYSHQVTPQTVDYSLSQMYHQPAQQQQMQSEQPLVSDSQSEQILKEFQQNLITLKNQLGDQIQHSQQQVIEQLAQEKEFKKVNKNQRTMRKKELQDKINELQSITANQKEELSQELQNLGAVVQNMSNNLLELKGLTAQNIQQPNQFSEPSEIFSKYLQPQYEELKRQIDGSLELVNQKLTDVESKKLQEISKDQVALKQTFEGEIGRMTVANEKNIAEVKTDLLKQLKTIQDSQSKQFISKLDKMNQEKKTNLNEQTKELRMFLDNVQKQSQAIKDSIKGFDALKKDLITEMTQQIKQVVESASESIKKAGANEMEGIEQRELKYVDLLKKIGEVQVVTNREIQQEFGGDYLRLSDRAKQIREKAEAIKPSADSRTSIQTKRQLEIQSQLQSLASTIETNAKVYEDYFKNTYEELNLAQQDETVMSRQFIQQQINDVDRNLNQYDSELTRFNIIASQTIGQNLLVIERPDPGDNDAILNLHKSVASLGKRHEKLVKEYKKTGEVPKEMMREYIVDFSKNAAMFAEQFGMFQAESEDLYRTIINDNVNQIQKAIEKGLASGAKSGMDQKYLEDLKDEFIALQADYAQRSFILSDYDANRIAAQLKAKYQDTPITKDLVKNFMLVQHFNQNKQQQLGKLFAQMLNLSPSFENADTIGHIKFNPEQRMITSEEMETLLNKDVFQTLMDQVLSGDQKGFFNKLSKAMKIDDNNIEQGFKNIIAPFLDALSSKMIAKYDHLIQKNIGDIGKFIGTDDLVLAALSRDQKELEGHARSWVNFSYDPQKLGSKGFLREEARLFREEVKTVNEQLKDYYEELNNQQEEEEKMEDEEFQIMNIGRRGGRPITDYEAMRLAPKPDKNSIFHIPDNQRQGPQPQVNGGGIGERIPKNLSMYSYAEGIAKGPTLDFFQKILPRRRKEAEQEVQDFEKLQNLEEIEPSADLIKKISQILTIGPNGSIKQVGSDEMVKRILTLQGEITASINSNIRLGRPVPASMIKYYTSLQQATKGIITIVGQNLGGQEKIQMLENIIDDQHQYLEYVLDTQLAQHREAKEYFGELEIKEAERFLQLAQSENQMKQRAQALLDIELKKLDLPPPEQEAPPPPVLSGTYGSAPITSGQFLSHQKGLGGGYFGGKGGFYAGVSKKRKVFGSAVGDQGSGIQQNKQGNATIKSEQGEDYRLKNQQNLPKEFDEKQRRFITNVYYDGKQRKLMFNEKDGKVRELSKEERQFLSNTFAQIFYYIFEHFLSVMIQSKRESLQRDLENILLDEDTRVQHDLMKIMNKAIKKLSGHNVTQAEMDAMVDKVHKLVSKSSNEEKKEEMKERKEMKRIEREEKKLMNSEEQQQTNPEQQQ